MNLVFWLCIRKEFKKAMTEKFGPIMTTAQQLGIATIEFYVKQMTTLDPTQRSPGEIPE